MTRNWLIGIADATAAVLTDAHTATTTIVAGQDDVPKTLTAHAHSWRQAGRPGLDRLRAVLNPFHDGWTLRASADGRHDNGTSR